MLTAGSLSDGVWPDFRLMAWHDTLSLADAVDGQGTEFHRSRRSECPENTVRFARIGQDLRLGRARRTTVGKMKFSLRCT